ncbi:MAG: DUF1294 domain-containing protein [Epulopiscium sp.]|nr:DUF1294 domain-containing protein [Candidatus Epulonipiscium sp.]
MNIYILTILLFINAISWASFGIDKRKALKNQWRISEKALLLLSFFGPFGAFLGMKFFHHKTKKLKFKLLIPLFLCLQVGIYIYLFVYPF